MQFIQQNINIKIKMQYILHKYQPNPSPRTKTHLQFISTTTDLCETFLVVSTFISLSLAYHHPEGGVTNGFRVWMLVDGYATLAMVVAGFLVKVLERCTLKERGWIVRLIVGVAKTIIVAVGMGFFFSQDWNTCMPILLNLFYLYFGVFIAIGYRVVNWVLQIMFVEVVEDRTTNHQFEEQFKTSIRASSSIKVSGGRQKQLPNTLEVPRDANMGVSSASNLRETEEYKVSSCGPNFNRKEQRNSRQIQQQKVLSCPLPLKQSKTSREIQLLPVPAIPETQQEFEPEPCPPAQSKEPKEQQFDINKSRIEIDGSHLRGTEMPPSPKRGKLGMNRMNSNRM